MKYLLLVYARESDLEAVADEECVDYDAKLRASGACVGSEALQPIREATTVRVRDGRITVTDGPFAETKEQLTGFYLDAAIRLAAGIPPARVGSIEVRPIRPIRETVDAERRRDARGEPRLQEETR